MNAVGVPSSKLFAPVLMGAAILAIQSGSVLTTLPMGLMIALSGMIHMVAMALRDAEFRALTTNYSLNAKDAFAYGCMVLFDAILLFGLVSDAGLLLPWRSFLSITGIIIVIMPVAVFFILRKHYTPETALHRGGMRHWNPPIVLLLLFFALWSFERLQSPSGSQHYLWLVLFSVNLATTDPKTTLEGTAKFARYALFAGLSFLLIWNYLNI